MAAIMKRGKAPVSGAALEYARDNSGVDAATIEKKFPKIRAWEGGKARPTMAQAKALAKFYDRPLTFFYLREIPEDMKDRELHDFRSKNKGPFSANLRRLLRRADARQKWAREFLNESPESGRFEPPRDFGGRPEDAEMLGVKIREWLGIDGGKLGAMRWRNEALKYWRNLAEDRGIVVLQSVTAHAHRVERDEFSGCAMADDIAPVAVLNPADNSARRIFTLAHELAHLWIGKPGVSHVSFRADASAGDPDEAYCNRAAAAALLPGDGFINMWKECGGKDRDRIEKVAGMCKVSHTMTAVRAKTFQLITPARCDELRDMYDYLFKKEAAAKKKKSEDGDSPVIISRDAKAVQRVGGYFGGLTLSAYEQGFISAPDVSDLLGEKLDHLGKIAARLNVHLHRWGRP